MSTRFLAYRKPVRDRVYMSDHMLTRRDWCLTIASLAFILAVIALGVFRFCGVTP